MSVQDPDVRAVRVVPGPAGQADGDVGQQVRGPERGQQCGQHHPEGLQEVQHDEEVRGHHQRRAEEREQAEQEVPGSARWASDNLSTYSETRGHC